MPVFYVCSFGGSGSTALCRYLGNFGSRVYHVHSRRPPPRLTEVDLFTEHFTNVPVKDPDVRVLFVYRDPVRAILSRFESPVHLKNIECAPTTLEAVVASGQDLYGLSEFFYNYLDSRKRNYPILFVKYEALFTHLPLVHRMLGIPQKPGIALERRETLRVRPEEKALRDIYAKLNRAMAAMPPCASL